MGLGEACRLGKTKTRNKSTHGSYIVRAMCESPRPRTLHECQAQVSSCGLAHISYPRKPTLTTQPHPPACPTHPWTHHRAQSLVLPLLTLLSPKRLPASTVWVSWSSLEQLSPGVVALRLPVQSPLNVTGHIPSACGREATGWMLLPSRHPFSSSPGDPTPIYRASFTLSPGTGQPPPA